ncbi:MAG: glycosyltransferase family 2 protein [Firmicutes bacterium HGW-Firmicutes-1]|nr:MAG: glycosyltransferase family 2 protein [Firmicutes bacterium HGW-Firmicutes-1]
MKIGVLITTYNDDKIINHSLSAAYKQNYENLLIVCVDDGSKIPVQKLIQFEHAEERLKIINLEHSERAVARQAGIDYLKSMNVDYFLFIDSDMKLSKGFIKKSVEFIRETDVDGIIYPEIAYSKSQNYWTKVKVFERNLYQIHYEQYTSSSIEAARMWKTTSFLGFEEGLKAFEEIQPTLKGFENGQKILKIKDVAIFHDEKHVTFLNLVAKKKGYFVSMGEHESVKLKNVLPRFYFFRKQLYYKENLIKYLSKPHLFAGVVVMYLYLSFLAFSNFILLKRGVEKCM